MVVFENDAAYVHWKLEQSRNHEVAKMRLEHFLALVHTSDSEAEFRARFWASSELVIEWRTESGKIKRKQAGVGV